MRAYPPSAALHALAHPDDARCSVGCGLSSRNPTHTGRRCSGRDSVPRRTALCQARADGDCPGLDRFVPAVSANAVSSSSLRRRLTSGRNPEELGSANGRGGGIRTHGLFVPKQNRGPISRGYSGPSAVIPAVRVRGRAATFGVVVTQLVTQLTVTLLAMRERGGRCRGPSHRSRVEVADLLDLDVVAPVVPGVRQASVVGHREPAGCVPLMAPRRHKRAFPSLVAEVHCRGSCAFGSVDELVRPLLGVGGFGWFPGRI